MLKILFLTILRIFLNLLCISLVKVMAFTCNDCSSALSSCAKGMDNRYCQGGKCGCRDGLASSHSYLGEDPNKKLVEMYYLDSGGYLKYYVWFCDELPVEECECEYPRVFDEGCQCPDGYIEGDFSSADSQPAIGGCVYECAENTLGEKITTSTALQCSIYCDQLENAFFDGEKCQLGAESNCSGEGKIVRDGVCACDVSAGYIIQIDDSLPDGWECVQIKCFSAEQFFDVKTNSCVTYCSDGSSDIYCQCYEHETKHTVGDTTDSLSICVKTPIDDDTGSDGDGSDDDTGSDGGDGGNGDDCGTIESGTYVTSSSSSCTCSSGSKKTGTVNGENIAYCVDSDSDGGDDGDGDGFTDGNWATESTASSIENNTSNIVTNTSDIAETLDSIENVITTPSSFTVTEFSPSKYFKNFDIPSDFNVMSSPEVQLSKEQFFDYIKTSRERLNMAIGFEEIQSSSTTLPCLNIPFLMNTSTEFCLQPFSDILDNFRIVLLFLSALASFIIILK